MINIKEGIKKYWWIPVALVVIPIVWVLGRYLKQREKAKIYVEEWLKP